MQTTVSRDNTSWLNTIIRDSCWQFSSKIKWWFFFCHLRVFFQSLYILFLSLGGGFVLTFWTLPFFFPILFFCFTLPYLLLQTSWPSLNFAVIIYEWIRSIMFHQPTCPWIGYTSSCKNLQWTEYARLCLWSWLNNRCARNPMREKS